MKTPADYGMRDWDELTFSSQIDSSTFLTLTVKEEGTGHSPSLCERPTRLTTSWTSTTRWCPPTTVDYGDGVFLFNGKRIKGHHTPKVLGTVDGDEIDVTFRVRG
jgi:hypothetical protein